MQLNVFLGLTVLSYLNIAPLCFCVLMRLCRVKGFKRQTIRQFSLWLQLYVGCYSLGEVKSFLFGYNFMFVVIRLQEFTISFLYFCHVYWFATIIPFNQDYFSNSVPEVLCLNSCFFIHRYTLATMMENMRR